MEKYPYNTLQKYRETTLRFTSPCPNLTLKELSHFIVHCRGKVRTDMNWDKDKKKHLPTKEYTYESKFGQFIYRYHRSKNLITILDFERSTPLK